MRILIRPLLGQAHVSLILFTTFALAALHNVTVDDSVLTGTVVPQYLPSASAWNQGNTCQGCAAQPDPAMAYNGTWHDASYSLLSGPFLSFEFSFAGTALYLYFILANAPNFLLLTATTSVNVTVDGVTFPPFVHFPTPGAGYQYNVPVFAAESLASGTHTVTLQPIVPTSAPTDSVLMLFDYLIYS
ncbi:hypothetical protein L210DRAFT_3390326 [Boletus edulis BED1]|uniref:Uncharacterized protein n=1 Tax=Boletus edulis BED1 TaxID=1328754 RepID=A0AAD4C2J3_BOLED|nr:hypothetical protein L210DRAFT_3390326 [Boletus edulis BED1]